MGFRYIGSKTPVMGEILSLIVSAVEKGARIADLMCGTAVVSAELRKRGFSVIANDIMTYSFHHARVMLLFNEPPRFELASEFVRDFGTKRGDQIFDSSPYESMLDALMNVPAAKGYFWREFSRAGVPMNGEKPRNYFSPENAMKIDAVRSWLVRLKHDGSINDLEHSLLIHDLIMASNDVANIAGTNVHFLAVLYGRAKYPLELKPTPLLLISDAGKHSVLQGYAEEIASSIICDLCYLDPPYMKRQYAANYHVLETLARGDEPEAVGVSGLRPWQDQYSRFCTKTYIRESLGAVISGMSCPRYLISYSEDGLLSIDEMENVLSQFGEVKTHSFTHKRFRSNTSLRGRTLQEYVIHLSVR